jgi:acyl carrier protein
MEDVPKRNNKVLRLNLGQRLVFEDIDDSMTIAERHFEAVCPLPETPLSEKITMQRCEIDCDTVASFITELPMGSLDVQVSQSSRDGLPQVVLSLRGEDTAPPNSKAIADQLRQEMRAALHGYLVPTTISWIGDSADRHDQKACASEKNSSSVEQRVCEIFADILSCSVSDISPQSDFFQLGGDSLKAGRLLSTLRKELQIKLHIGMLFTNSQVRGLSQLIEQTLSTTKSEERDEQIEIETPRSTKTYSSTNPFLLCIQLLPIAIFYPMKRGFDLTVFIFTLTLALSFWPGEETVLSRVLNLLFALAVARIVSQIVFPILAILTKWIVVGRYREGMYPMWGFYHTRWWITQKLLSIGELVSAECPNKSNGV